MIDPVEKNNILVEIISWVALNMVAIFFIGFSIYFGFGSNPILLRSMTHHESIDQAIDMITTISIFGGGVLIAGCQWIFLRRLLPEITGGGWAWIVSGVVSSIGGFFVAGILTLGLGDFPTEKDNLFLTILIVSEHIIFLSIVQGFLLHANQYKRASRWVIINVFAYGLVVVFSYNLIYQWTAIFEMLIILPTFLMIAATGVSGWELIRARKSHDESQVEHSLQETGPKIKTVYFFRANLENQDFRGQNFDGADFRKANLRKAILEEVSCEPVRVKKMGEGWLSLFFGHSHLSVPGSAQSPFFVEEMKSTNFTEADLTGANLTRARLRGAIFRYAILRNANLSNATLVDADLCEADLGNANLSYTDMSHAMLYKTNLKGADLTGAKLDGADFDGASLENAILHNVDLRMVKYLERAHLTGADPEQRNHA